MTSEAKSRQKAHSLTPEPTAQEWLQTARQKIDLLDARLLLAHVAGISRIDLISQPDRSILPEVVETLDCLIHRRAAGEPLAYLTGETIFRGRKFMITPAVLVPRPETEELAGLALKHLANLAVMRPRVLDLGTGSGVIAISLALEYPKAEVTGIEISPAALEIARANAIALNANIRFITSDWFAALSGERFHVVTANPPYIAADEQHLSGDGLRFEPRSALTDEGDGLSCLTAIIQAAPRYLEEGGALFCEHGHTQGGAVQRLLADAGLVDIHNWYDLSGNKRFSSGTFRHKTI